jgi:hypothetical protein
MRHGDDMRVERRAVRCSCWSCGWRTTLRGTRSCGRSRGPRTSTCSTRYEQCLNRAAHRRSCDAMRLNARASRKPAAVSPRPQQRLRVLHPAASNARSAVLTSDPSHRKSCATRRQHCQVRCRQVSVAVAAKATAVIALPLCPPSRLALPSVPLTPSGRAACGAGSIGFNVLERKGVRRNTALLRVSRNRC